jgi:hypothetical protein
MAEDKQSNTYVVSNAILILVLFAVSTMHFHSQRPVCDNTLYSYPLTGLGVEVRM